MKWRDVKILCAGMCVCTVIVALNPIQDRIASQVTELTEGADIGEGLSNEEETESFPEVRAERHKVYEVGNGINNEETEQMESLEVVQNDAESVPESNLIIADVTNYVNIRSLPSEEGEILGKLYDDSVGRKHGEENGWYYIESGSVKGYVKAEFVLTGEAAEIRAKEVGTRLAEVTTTTLKVRQEPTTESIVLGLVPGGDILSVIEEVEGWVKVDVEDGPGYVSTDYVNVYTENVAAESKEEEAARLKKEEEARKRAEEAAKEALRQQQMASKPTSKPVSGSNGNGSNAASGNTGSSGSGSNTASGSSGNSENSSSASTVGLGQQIADYALRFVGNPYVYGGTSLTNGADCSGFVQSVYKHFGISLPRHSGDQGKAGRAVNGLGNAKSGDLVWYSGHIGIYIGNGKIVHASNEKNGIMVSEASYRTILGIRRIV